MSIHSKIHFLFVYNIIDKLDGKQCILREFDKLEKKNQDEFVCSLMNEYINSNNESKTEYYWKCINFIMPVREGRFVQNIESIV